MFLFLLLSLVFVKEAAATLTAKPNIVIVVADDLVSHSYTLFLIAHPLLISF